MLQMFRDDANKAQPGQADTVLASSEEGAAAADSQEQRGQPRFSDYVHQTLSRSLFKDHGSPEALRKVGPSLRFVSAEKLDAQFLFDWIQRQISFDYTHAAQAFRVVESSAGQRVGRRLESLAIYSMATYLRERSQAYDYSQPPAGVTPVTTAAQSQTQIPRGRIVFEQSGCLVCHNHADSRMWPNTGMRMPWNWAPTCLIRRPS